MTKIQIPGISIGPITLNRGQLLDIWLLTVHVIIPPISIQLIPRITLWEPFILFDTDDIANAIIGALGAIPNAVWSFVTTWLEQQANEYEKTHPEET